MTGNKERLDDFQVIQGGKVTFGGGEGRICDKKNRVLFTDTKCLVLSKDFKLPDESMMVLRVPMKHNLYAINLNNLCLMGNLACLVAHASVDESMKWHRRMGYVNYKNINRLVKGNLVRGLPSKIFKNDHTCVTCCKGKFDGKADEGYIVGYSVNNKAYRVYNMPNKRVEETMNMRFLKEKPNVQGLGHEWYFDLDYLTNTLGYKHVQANQSAEAQKATTNPVGTQDADLDSDCDEQVIIVPFYPSYSIQGTEPTDTSGDEVDDSSLNSADEIFQKELARLKGPKQKATSDAESLVLACATMVSTDDVPVHSSSSTDSFFNDEPTTRFLYPSDLGNHDPSPGIFSSSSYDDEFGAALNNVASIMKRDNHTRCSCANKMQGQTDYYCVAQALEDPTWVDAMQEEMQQFKFQNVWVLVDLSADKYAIGTKWILKNKRDARGIVVRNKARLHRVPVSALLP
nr:putative ribonuclease H-like domain-containing protein [Tanacetum cinerariifolium]